MRFATTSILAALIATSQAYIQAISVPKTIKPGDTVNLKLISATNMMTVDDIAVAFGYATGNGYAGALGTNLASFYLGPGESNLGSTVITKTVAFPSDIPKGNGVVSASLFSLFGAAKSPSLTNWNVTITFGDVTSSSYKNSN
ncbi:unnamed protein product [Clonostachys solani]|uniref:Uncharacterized protein n=1 Tax=Clonostachys solani TaxID=160281 RepID=A0A9N9ZN66_9HYPO|nr:unnamed protein product [Clonostachys solani]